MSVIYLLRHGETEWNVERRRQGRLNSPLTARGLGQARDVARRLAAELDRVNADVPKLISSPIGRARSTAQIVAEELGIPASALGVEPRLAEHDMGGWQGLTDDEIERRYPGGLADRAANKWTFVMPDGESYQGVVARAAAWLAAAADEPLVVAVGHEMINRVVLGTYAGLTPDEILALWHPHDVIYRLEGSTFEKVAAPVQAA